MKKLTVALLVLGATSLTAACSGDPARQQIDAANQKAADAAARADQAAQSAQEAAQAAKAAEAAAEAAADKVARMNNSGLRK